MSFFSFLKNIGLICSDLEIFNLLSAKRENILSFDMVHFFIPMSNLNSKSIYLLVSAEHFKVFQEQ